MPLIQHQKSTVSPRRLRPAHVSCRGGASSLLRLTLPAAKRLPSTRDLSGWLDQAASVLLPVTGPHFDIGSAA